ncbi:MAG: hypothetical protein ACXV3F_08330 [Frankiaceae bacterium]
MYARLQTVRSLPAEGRGENSRRLVDAVCTHPGFAGICLATQLGRPAGACLTLWETHEDAEAASARTRAQLGPRPFPLATDDVYEVIDHVRHSEPVDAAAVVNLVWLDGPRSPEQQAADELSGMRIKRALQPVDGHRLTPGGARGRPEAVPTRGELRRSVPRRSLPC